MRMIDPIPSHPTAYNLTTIIITHNKTNKVTLNSLGKH